MGAPAQKIIKTKIEKTIFYDQKNMLSKIPGSKTIFILTKNPKYQKYEFIENRKSGMKGRLIQRKIMIFGPGCKNFLGASHGGHQIFQISQKPRFKDQLKIGKNRIKSEKIA